MADDARPGSGDSPEPSDRLLHHLGDRYRLIECIGEGASAVVYRAADHLSGEDVAIKVLRPEFAASLAGDRFAREVRLAHALRHPGVLPVLDSGGSGDCLYYVMPFIAGPSLRDRIAREGPLPVDEALRITREVAEVLALAHEQGLVHRDIKPANILLATERTMVADFGLARAVEEAGTDRLTESGLAVGTPAYMSPEQAGASADVDARSDQYSLACVLYTMLSGEPPFTGRTAWAVIARHLRERPPSLSIVRPNLSDSIEIAVDRALSKVPADRFETVEDFVAALSDASLLHPSAPRRWPWAAALVAAVAATLLAVLTRPPPLNASRVVGFPLEDRSVDPKGPTGADLAMVMGVGLEHAPVKWYDGWKWLPSDLRSAGLVAPDVASEIARSLEARYYLTGTVRVDADSVRVVVELMDVLGDSLAQRASEVAATGDADGTRLALRALVRLLPALLGTDGPRVDLSYLLDRDPSALAFWIRGDQHYRSSRFREALASYQQALDVDPQLALAALKGAQAASWIYAAPDARSLVGVALAHEELLPDQKRLYARGLQAYLVGDADQAVELLREAVGVDAAWPEAWMTLGEAMYHLVPSSWSGPGAPDSAFARVLELDPGFTPAAIHLAEAYTRENDAASVAALMDRLIDGQADPIVVRRVRWLLECLESGFPEMEHGGARATPGRLRRRSVPGRVRRTPGVRRPGVRAHSGRRRRRSRRHLERPAGALRGARGAGADGRRGTAHGLPVPGGSHLRGTPVHAQRRVRRWPRSTSVCLRGLRDGHLPRALRGRLPPHGDHDHPVNAGGLVPRARRLRRGRHDRAGGGGPSRRLGHAPGFDRQRGDRRLGAPGERRYDRRDRAFRVPPPRAPGLRPGMGPVGESCV
jgi:tRNA A-37 threonylcarbamoyl transferase component Bud32/tetratricopeptide (TPR) repeat protein